MQEKRATMRHSFGVEQIVAGTVDGKMPPLESFRRVRCIDISKDGFAYYQEERPDYAELVVGLGLPPNVVYLQARVAHSEMIELCGNLVFRVGCEFTGRAQWNEQPEDVLSQGEVDAFKFLSEHTPQQE